MNNPVDTLCVNTIRVLSIDAVEAASSGHPGLPLGAAPMGYVLWQRHLKHCPSAPTWPDRDRFVLSAGHGSMLLYSLLHLTGYPLPMAELKRFRQLGSKTPGHPEFGVTPGVEATTGPLGQGDANAVGMAIAERMLAAQFNRPNFELFNHFTYVLMSDGCAMEGVATEAASLAGHLKLGKLIVLYDANDVTLDGPADTCFTEDVSARYAAYGWHVQQVDDGNTDFAGLDAAISAARAETMRPSLIIVKTTIGFGSPNKAGSAAAHGSPLGKEEVAATKAALGWTYPQFFVPPEAQAHFDQGVARSAGAYARWLQLRAAYQVAHPDLSRTLDRVLAGEPPSGLEEALKSLDFGQSGIETRTAAGIAENAIAAVMPELVGGDADLGGSTKSVLKGMGSFNGQTGTGRNIHFGVREHAMAAIANGICYHGGLRPFVATFFCFADYMRPSVRLSAMNHLPVIYLWTHDSVALGEDGPTHQPVEHLMALRTIPNLVVMRPSDGAESAQAWLFAVRRTHGPTGLVLTRQKVGAIDRRKVASAEGLHRGAYVLAECSRSPATAIIIATGSEVSLALKAREALEDEGISIRVVSMPSMEVFAMQPLEYRNHVLPPQVQARVSVEAGVTFGWEKWVGPRGMSVGIDTFGVSAPEKDVVAHFGFTAAALVETVRKYVAG